jgi:hypothetical protein
LANLFRLANGHNLEPLATGQEAETGGLDRARLARDFGLVIEVFYNRSRQHSSLGHVSPLRFLAGWIGSQHAQAVAA